MYGIAYALMQKLAHRISHGVIVCAIALGAIATTRASARTTDQTPPTLLRLRVAVQGAAPASDWEFAHEALGVTTRLRADGTETYIAYPAGQWRIAQIVKPGYASSVMCDAAQWEGLSDHEVRVTLPSAAITMCVFSNTYVGEPPPPPPPPPSPSPTSIPPATATTAAPEPQPQPRATKTPKPTKTPTCFYTPPTSRSGA